MYRRPHWRSYPLPNSHDSPFDRGRNERPVGVTIHAKGLGIPASEAAALAVLREVVACDGCEYADTSADSARHLVVDPDIRVQPSNYCPVTIEGPTGAARFTGISHPEQEDARVERLTLSPTERAAIRTEVFITAAHQALRHDLLVTTSPFLLNLRTARGYEHFNICPPTEAIKLVGLFLRSRDTYAVSGPPRCTVTIDPATFYVALARSKVERLWRNDRAWKAMFRSHPQVARLHRSMIVRCRRALEARDAIGFQFYRNQSERTADVILYHFDYLTLLLSGAFDASARIARIVYNVPVKQQRASWWREEFLRALRDVAPTSLFALATSDPFQSLRTLLSGLRNTIHAAALRPVRYTSSHEPELSLVELESGGEEIWKIAECYGGPDSWGLVRKIRFELEPYTYATRLTDTCFDLLSRVAEATNAELVLAPDTAAADMEQPEWISAEVLRRVALLGD